MKNSISKKTFSFFAPFLLQIFLSLSLSPNPCFAQTLNSRRLITMNIQCYENNWEFRLQKILNHFISLNPDILAFQEVCTDPANHRSQINFILQYLENHGYPVKSFESQYTHQAWGRYDEYILVTSKHPAQKWDKGFLPFSPLQRGYVGLLIDGIWYVNTHLEFREDQANYRSQQIEFLQNHFAESASVTMGDFNSAPESNEQKSFHENNYVPFFPGPSHIGNDHNGSNRIDGFWLSRSMAERVQNPLSYIFLNQQIEGQFLSDHFAVNLEFKF